MIPKSFRKKPDTPRHASGVLVFVLSAVAVLSCVSNAAASAANIYVGQSSSGAGGGTSCSDTKAYTFFNSSANWGSGSTQIGPGTMVHICGTITGNSGANGFVFQGSGTSGSPVTLKFEPGAILQSPRWGVGYSGTPNGGIVISGTSWVTVDGGGTGSAGAGTFVPNGILQNTLNGTAGGACPGGTCTTSADSTGIYIGGSANNVVIQNLEVLNIYKRTSMSDECGGGGCGGWDILKIGGGSSATVTNNVFSQTSAVLWWDLGSSGADAFLNVTNNDISNTSAGIDLAQGNGGSGTIVSTLINGNHYHDFNSWNESSTYNYHHDGLHVFSYTTPLTNITVSNNLYTGDFGSGTAWVYYEQYASGTGSMNIYNNVFNFYATQSGNGAGGSQSIEIEGNAITTKIYNNTIIGVSHSGSIASGIYVNSAPSGGIDMRNNSISGALEELLLSSGSFKPSNANYNDYDFSGGSVLSINGNGYAAADMAAWRSACGCDSASVTVQPNLSSSMVPSSTSKLVAAAQNLTSLGITPLDTDKGGAPRPPSANWDIGAYQSGAATSQLPAAPTGLTVSVQ